MNLLENQKLYDLCMDIDKGYMIEIGALYGETACVMSVRGLPVISVDNLCWNPNGLTRDKHRTRLQMNLSGVKNVMFVEKDSERFRDTWKRICSTPPSLVFLDAEHSYESVRDEILWALDIGCDLICGHDYCEQFAGVKQAVDELLGTVNLEGTFWWKKIA